MNLVAAAGAPFADYTGTLKQRAGLRWPIALRRFAQMRRDYPAAPFMVPSRPPRTMASTTSTGSSE